MRFENLESRESHASGESSWTRFWFARAPSDTLALVRLFLGLSCVLRFTGLYGFANRAVQGKLGFGLPIHRFSAGSWRFDDVHVPLVDGVPGLTLAQYHSLEAAALVLGALFCLGAGARVVGPLLGVVLLWMQVFDQAAFKHHLFTLGIACLVVGLGPCSDRFSLDALVLQRFKHVARGPRLRSVLPLRMLQTLVSAVYLFSTVAKVNASWLEGFLFRWTVEKSPAPPETLLGILQRGPLAGPWYIALSWGTLVIEAFLVFGFWHPRLRPWALAVGYVLHASIELTLDVGSYSSTMLALYVAFLWPQARSTIVRFDPGRASSRRAALVVRLLDWGARFTVVPGALQPDERGNSPLLEAGPADGGWKHTGERAIWFLLARLPLLQPVGLVGETWWKWRRRVVDETRLG